MKKITLLLLLISNVILAQVSETELLAKPLFTTKQEALKDPKAVFRARLQDYVSTDYKVLEKLVNCQALSFVAASNVTVIPLGFGKLVNLQYLDISETTITTVSMFTKKNKLLKVVCAKAGQLTASEKKSLEKRSIKVIEDAASFPAVIKGGAANANTVVTTSSTPVTTANTTPTNTTPTNTNTNTSNSNGSLSPALKSVTKDAAGKFILNPDNVTVDPDKMVWAVQQNGKSVIYKKSFQHGLFNGKGELIALFPTTTSIDPSARFSEGLISVSMREGSMGPQKFGYMDSIGNVVINPQFESAGEFKNGKALVKVNGKNGYIDKKGTVLITGDFEERAPFYHTNFAIIKFKGDPNYSIINDKGEMLAKNTLTAEETDFPGEITTKEALEVGLFKSKLKPKGQLFDRWGFKNMKGEWVIKPIYTQVSFFSGGLATVKLGKTDKIGADGFVVSMEASAAGDYGAIDKTGKYVLPAKYMSMSDPWHNHYEDEISISAELVNKKWEIFDSKGNVIFTPPQKYLTAGILRMEPIKNDYIVIEYYAGKKIWRHWTDNYQAFCDILTKDGKAVVEKNEYNCFTVNEYGFYGYRNYSDCIYTPGEGTNEMHAGISHVNGKNLYHQKDGLLYKEKWAFQCFQLRENPRDTYRERKFSTYFHDQKNTTVPARVSADGTPISTKTEVVGSYTASGINITNVEKTTVLSSFSKVNGGIKDGRDVFRYSYWDASGKYAGTLLFSLSQNKIIFQNNEGKNLGEFSENRFYAPMVGYKIEKAN